MTPTVYFTCVVEGNIFNTFPFLPFIIYSPVFPLYLISSPNIPSLHFNFQPWLCENWSLQDDSAGWAQVLCVKWDGSFIWGGIMQTAVPFWSQGYTAWPSPQTATCTACRRHTARRAAARGSGTPWRRAAHRTDTGPGPSCRTEEHTLRQWKCLGGSGSVKRYAGGFN